MVIPILLYHGIGDDAPTGSERWVVHPQLFADHLAYLKEQGYAPVTVRRLTRCLHKRSERLPERPVVITFDDGYADFCSEALPLLASYEVKATLYITTGSVNSAEGWSESGGMPGRSMLSWRQVREIDDAGIECGAHTVSHPQLDTIPSEIARGEIIQSKDVLEQQLGKPVTTFAYPHGYYDSTVREIVRQAGYTSACGVKHALSSVGDDRFALARLIMEPATSVDVLARMLSGRGMEVAPKREKVRTKAWRLLRRTLCQGQRLKDQERGVSAG